MSEQTGEPVVAAAVTTHKPLGPVQEGDRIRSLDVLRGAAILGIFCVNIQFFSLPLMEAVGHLSMGGADTSERLGWAFIKAFCEYKFISMFSLLFGAGLIVQMLRAETAGRSFAAVYLRRLGILAVFGLAHALLLWYGDILFIYAILGTLLLALRKLQPRTLLIAAAVCIAISTTFTTGCGALQMFSAAFATETATSEEVAVDGDAADTEALAADTEALAEGDVAPGDPADQDAAPPRGLEAMQRAQFDPSREVWQTAETLAYQEGPFTDAFAFRAVSYGFAAISAIFGYGWRIVAMFMIGAALMKVDFFRPHRLPWQRRMMLLGLGIGLPIEVLAVALQWVNGFELDGWWLLSVGLHDLASVALCLGYVGTLCTLVSLGTAGWLTTPISYVGRLALSTYLLETIIATTIMYWWGLGWFNTLGRPEQLGLVVVVYAALVLFSVGWMQVFRIGPFEWLWRTLTYLRPQPLLRR